MDDYWQKFKAKETSFASVLYDTAMFNAINPVDHVFGLYGFYNGEPDDMIALDYDKSTTVVYKHVAQNLLEQDQPLHLLSYAGVGFFPEIHDWILVEERLPAWCPNRSNQLVVRALSYPKGHTEEHCYKAGGNIKRNPECSESNGFASLVLGVGLWAQLYL